MSKRRFFPILGTLQTGGGECSWRRLWATRIPSKKLSPTLLKDFWCFSGPGVGGSAAWGAPHHRALVALGRSWRICQRTRVEPAEPNLSAYARQPARGPTMWPILWLCWPMLVYLAGNVGPSCGYVGLCWPQVDSCWAKRSEKWEQQKNTVKRRIFWWSAAYLGAMLAHLGAVLAYLEGNVGLSWGYVGPSWGYVGPSWGYVGPSWGYVGPSWGYVGPSWGLCWPILRPIEAYVGPCWPILSHKIRKSAKNGKSTKHRKTRDILAGGRGRRQGARPLSPTERRETPSAMPRPGGPWPDLSAYARQPARGPTMLACFFWLLLLWLLVVGGRVVVGGWLLVVGCGRCCGCWLLVAGWLVVGCWLLGPFCAILVPC